MSPENVEAVELYSRWKMFGTEMFELLQLEYTDPLEREGLVTKFMVIENHAPAISEAMSGASQEAREMQQLKNRRGK